MSYVSCCGTKQSAITYEAYKAVLKGADREFFLYRPICKKCGKPILYRYALDDTGSVAYNKKYKSRDVPFLMDRLPMLAYKVKSIHTPPSRGGFYLNCSVHGKIEKCYSNLSSLAPTLGPWTDNLIPGDDNKLVVSPTGTHVLATPTDMT